MVWLDHPAFGKPHTDDKTTTPIPPKTTTTTTNNNNSYNIHVRTAAVAALASTIYLVPMEVRNKRILWMNLEMTRGEGRNNMPLEDEVGMEEAKIHGILITHRLLHHHQVRQVFLMMRSHPLPLCQRRSGRVVMI
jgi:hypothetical protein